MRANGKGSVFFGLVSRLKWINRWGLKYNVVQENVMEHSFSVATIAHFLALYLVQEEGRTDIDPNKIAVQALYHDVEESLLSDAPTPVKYSDPEFTRIYKQLEARAESLVLHSLPPGFVEAYKDLIISDLIPVTNKRIIKAADNLGALVKCDFELAQGNAEFSEAKLEVQERVILDSEEPYIGPAVRFFLAQCASSYGSTLDEQVRLSR